jgi:transposase
MFYHSRIKPKFKAKIGRPNVEVNIISIDLTKNIMHVREADNNAKVIFKKKKLQSDKLLEFRANQPKCLVGIEACGGSKKNS